MGEVQSHHARILEAAGLPCCMGTPPLQGLHLESTLVALAPPRPMGAKGERLEALVHELFCLQDLGDDGLLDEAELVRLNEQIAVLHYGKDADLAVVRRRYKTLFRERLHPEGLPVPFETFRRYMLKALDDMDSDEASQEMALEHFVDEATSARVRFLGCEPLMGTSSATLLVPVARRAALWGGS
mmetsp:Transcript_46283/g.106842  ORF Transcript_46283/g.106842 Transcript_46283/m.106842 type:complete len:185 (-) Transcript_46283:103-657(-)